MSDAAVAIAQAWKEWAVPAALSGAALGGAAMIADRMLPRGRCLGSRNAIWLSVLVVLCLPPGLHVFTITPGPGVIGAGTVVSGATDGAASGIVIAGFGVWLAGAMAATILAVRCQRRARRLGVGGDDITPPAWFLMMLQTAARQAGLPTTPPVRIVHAACVPAVIGGFRPMIVFPAKLLQSRPVADIGHALLHECMHLRRRDPIAAVLTAAIRILWWFHPAAHIAATRLADLREIGCDLDVARALGGQTGGYRRTLIRIAAPELLPALSLSLGFFGQRSGIVDRIEALRRPPPKGDRSRRGAAAALCAVLIACAVPGPPPEPALQAAAAVLPEGITWADLQGCLQKRWFVTGLLAREEAAPRK